MSCWNPVGNAAVPCSASQWTCQVYKSTRKFLFRIIFRNLILFQKNIIKLDNTFNGREALAPLTLDQPRNQCITAVALQPVQTTVTILDL